MARRPGDVQKWLGELHDYLWIPSWKGEPEALRRGLLGALESLDRAAYARGLLKRTAGAVLRQLDRSERTEGLYMYLSLLHELTLVAQAAKAGRLNEEARSAGQIVDSVLIHLAALCGRFELVEQYRKGTLDFAAYSSAIADAAESRGFREAGAAKRLLNTLHEAARTAPRLRSPAERAAAAAFLVQGSSWVLVNLPKWLKAIGSPPPPFYGTFPTLAARAARTA